MTDAVSVPVKEEVAPTFQSPEQYDEKRYWPFLDPKMVGKEIEAADGRRYQVLAVFSSE